MKEQLICEVESPEYSEKDPWLGEPGRQQVFVARRNSDAVIKTVLVVLVVGGLLLLAPLMYIQILRARPQQGLHVPMQMHMTMMGAEAMPQHVTSSVVDNYVIYNVVQSNQQMWILDDFDQKVQVMKVAGEEDTVCFVTDLDQEAATPPHVYTTGLQTDQKPRHRQTIFQSSELAPSEMARVGVRGMELCEGVPVFWVDPVRPEQVDSSSNSSAVTEHSRDKRNVKKCVESCCTLVCCCNQKFLQWQSSQFFNCHNICHGCSSMSKMSTLKKC